MAKFLIFSVSFTKFYWPAQTHNLVIIIVHAQTPSFLRYDIFHFAAQSCFKQAAVV